MDDIKINKEIRLHTRTDCPCNGCPERTIQPNCHDACPVDARGDYGYAAWQAEIEAVKKERKKHKPLSTGRFRY